MILVVPDDAGFEQAVNALQRDRVVAHPTETVYGLAANPFSPAALERLWKIKARDPKNPVLLIVDGVDQLAAITDEISARARQCMDRFWPGPLTLLLPKKTSLPTELTAGYPKVAVRCPAHPVPRRLCREAAMPLTSTSANRSGQQPASDPTQIELDGVALCLDGGGLPPSRPSTIYDPDDDRILRQGAIAAEALEHIRR